MGEGRPENQVCISKQQGNILSIINEMKDDLECHENKLATTHNTMTLLALVHVYTSKNFETSTKRSVNNIHGSVSISIHSFSSFAKKLEQSPFKLQAVT